MATIGVFDSGIGGLSVANAITEALPEHTVIFKNDSANVPYGTKTKDRLQELVVPILQTLIADGCDVIVIACNTITTLMITELRELLPVPLVGMEPMVKPAAAASKTKTIAVCATPATLASPRYHDLKKLYAKGVKVLEPDCSRWTLMIETNQIDRKNIQDIIDDACERGADVIVLGCTHYHWIEDIIKQATQNKAKVLQPEQPVIKQLTSVLAEVA